MPFTNPIIAGNEDLIRSGIKSPNYAPGSMGWRIAADGSSEFDNTVLRGDLTSGNFSNVPQYNGWKLANSGLATLTDLLVHGSETVINDLGVAGIIRMGQPQKVVATVDQIPVVPVERLGFLQIAGGWGNLGGVFHGAEFIQIGTRVSLRGLVTNVAGPLTAGTFYDVAYLPPGSRPSAIEPFTVQINDAASRVDVRGDGSIGVRPAVNVPTGGYVSLSDCSFSTL